MRRVQAAGANAGSERDANAAPRGASAPLVGHHHALDRAEHGHVAAGTVVEAEAGDGTTVLRLPGVTKEKFWPSSTVLMVVSPTRWSAMTPQWMLALSSPPARLVTQDRSTSPAPLQRAAADRQSLRRAGLAVAIEPARDVAQPRRRRQQIAAAVTFISSPSVAAISPHRRTGTLSAAPPPNGGGCHCELDSLSAKVEMSVVFDLDGGDRVAAQNEPSALRPELVQSRDTACAAHTWSQPALSALSAHTAAR